jgi:NADPH:quinone reductase-like Zn-dependent oxidoreductase
MKVWTTTGDGIDALTATDAARPRPGAGQVLVQLKAWSLNYRDLLVIQGESTWRPAHPVIPLTDGAGVVTQIGDGVTRLVPGDRVSAMCLPYWRSGPLTQDNYHSPIGGPKEPGMLADYVVLDQQHVEIVPHSLDDHEAATLPIAALTAWHAVATRCRVRPGNRVLIHGTGGVALFALQIAVALGAEVIVSTSSEPKAKRVVELGASQAINRGATKDVALDVLEWTGGTGVDHVIETVGGGNLNLSLRSVKIGGSIAFIGLLAGVSAPVNTYDFVTKNVDLHGIETGSAEMYRDMASFIDERRIKPVIDDILPVTDVHAALHRLSTGDHFGKIVLAAD